MPVWDASVTLRGGALKLHGEQVAHRTIGGIKGRHGAASGGPVAVKVEQVKGGLTITLRL